MRARRRWWVPAAGACGVGVALALGLGEGACDGGSSTSIVAAGGGPSSSVVASAGVWASSSSSLGGAAPAGIEPAACLPRPGQPVRVPTRSADGLMHLADEAG